VAQRRFTRIHFNAKVFIRARNRSFSADSLNMSVRGMFVKTHEHLAVGDPVEIDVNIPSASRSSLLKLHGVVTRVEHQGIALDFGMLDADTFLHLKNTLNQRTRHRLKPFDD